MSKTSTITIQRVQCELCEKQFVNKTVLKKHINAIHNNIFLFKCPHQNCEITFRTGYRLYVHELFHKGICRKRYIKSSSQISFHNLLL